MTAIATTRRNLLRHRFARHGLANAPASLQRVTDAAILDAGVQDTGPDGHSWALVARGAPLEDRDGWNDDLFLAWTLRGAPHAYRRRDAELIAVATAPFSATDAGKRIFDAVKPLRAAELDLFDALRLVADEERAIVVDPTVKGDVSGALNERLPAPFLRACRPCDAIHIYEQPFRLAALQAGLALAADTSPPVLYRLPELRPLRYEHLGSEADPRVHVVRSALRFSPGSRLPDLNAVIDGSAADIKSQVPDDTIPVTVSDDPIAKGGRMALADDAADLAGDAAIDGRTVRLLGPYDPYLQFRDRELLVPEEAHRKDLWRILGRPGAVVADGEIIATWRPKASGTTLSIEVQPWGALTGADQRRIDAEAQRLAEFRTRSLKAVRYLD